MKPKPRSLTTFLIVPLVIDPYLILEPGENAPPVREGSTTAPQETWQPFHGTPCLRFRRITTVSRAFWVPPSPVSGCRQGFGLPRRALRPFRPPTLLPRSIAPCAGGGGSSWRRCSCSASPWVWSPPRQRGDCQSNSVTPSSRGFCSLTACRLGTRRHDGSNRMACCDPRRCCPSSRRRIGRSGRGGCTAR